MTRELPPGWFVARANERAHYVYYGFLLCGRTPRTSLLSPRQAEPQCPTCLRFVARAQKSSGTHRPTTFARRSSRTNEVANG